MIVNLRSTSERLTVALPARVTVPITADYEPAYLDVSLGGTTSPKQSGDYIDGDIRWTYSMRRTVDQTADITMTAQWSGTGQYYHAIRYGGVLTLGLNSRTPTGTVGPRYDFSAPGGTAIPWLNRVLPPNVDGFFGTELNLFVPRTYDIESLDRGKTWIRGGVSPQTNPTFVVFDTNSAIEIGVRGGGSKWIGRIYWAQMDAINRARLVFPGIAGNWLTIPTASMTLPTGDIECVARVSKPVWNSPAGIVVCKNGPFYMLIDHRVSFWSNAGTSTFPASAPHGAVDGSTIWIKATRVASTGVTAFYWAPDSPSEPTAWTAIGTATGQTGPLVDNTQPVSFGAYNSNGNPLAGRILRAIVRNAIGGAIASTILDVNENNAGTMQTPSTFKATTGQTVTVNQVAPSVIVQPQPDRLMWRFDANEYPGTGQSFTDPRGRVWSLYSVSTLIPIKRRPPVTTVPLAEMPKVTVSLPNPNAITVSI